MAEKNFMLALAKVIIAASWVDGEVNHDEINCLKDLLFRLEDLTGREWASLEIYIDAPVDEAERRALVHDLVRRIGNADEKKLALETLRKVVAVDGQTTDDEAAAVAEIEQAIEAADPGVFEKLQGYLRRAVGQRTARFEKQHGRCAHLDDYLLNKVYYGVQRRRDKGDDAPNIPEDRLRKLSLAAGLMARVAHADMRIDPAERTTINSALQNSWEITEDEAALMTEIALDEVTPDVDYYRLTRNFYASTTQQERIAFLDLLFAVALADGMVTRDEIQEIQNIAKSLKLTQRDFVYAKKKISEDRREA